MTLMAKNISKADKKRNTYVVWGVIIAVIAVVVVVAVWSNHRPSKYSPLAQCIASSGTHMYGAFWCPHCQEQEAMFGGKQILQSAGVYVECSLPDHSQDAICNQHNISGYPTWILANGTRLDGVQDLYSLAEATNCTSKLPQ